MKLDDLSPLRGIALAVGIGLILWLLIIGFAFAQTSPPDPAILQREIIVVRAQRNNALDNAANAWAQYQLILEQLTAANTKITELEAKIPKP